MALHRAVRVSHQNPDGCIIVNDEYSAHPNPFVRRHLGGLACRRLPLGPGVHHGLEVEDLIEALRLDELRR